MYSQNCLETDSIKTCWTVRKSFWLTRAFLNEYTFRRIRNDFRGGGLSPLNSPLVTSMVKYGERVGQGVQSTQKSSAWRGRILIILTSSYVLCTRFVNGMIFGFVSAGLHLSGTDEHDKLHVQRQIRGNVYRNRLCVFIFVSFYRI